MEKNLATLQSGYDAGMLQSGVDNESYLRLIKEYPLTSSEETASPSEVEGPVDQSNGDYLRSINESNRERESCEERLEAQRKEYEEKINACEEIEKQLNTQHEEIEAQRKKYKEMEENLRALEEKLKAEEEEVDEMNEEANKKLRDYEAEVRDFRKNAKQRRMQHWHRELRRQYPDKFSV